MEIKDCVCLCEARRQAKRQHKYRLSKGLLRPLFIYISIVWKYLTLLHIIIYNMYI